MTLFANLPEQSPPSAIWVDEHSLEDCSKCRGTGRHRYYAISGGYQAQRFTEACRHCRGGGKVLRYIGPAT
jgi:DnaJ-class molecular chaperone